MWFHVTAVVGVAALFTAGLGSRELVSSHEARAAQNAQRMLDTGEWGLPVLFDGQVDLQKPPGYYWLVAAAGWLNGGTVTEACARLPAALAGLLTVALVYGWLRREGRPVAAVVAALTLATAGHFTAISRTARIDVPLTCAVAVALVAFYRGTNAPASGPRQRAVPQRHSCAEEQPADAGRSPFRHPYFLLAAVAAAAGVLLKGPVALALVGPAAVAWLVVKPRGGGGLPVPAALLGVTVVLGLAAPWFLWANAATDGEFVRVFFWHHNVERFAGTSPTLASHPVWYYLPRLAADFLPWTPALALLTAWAVRTGGWRADPLFRFGVVWVVTMFAVLSAAKFKRADYLLPLYPGAAVVLGCAAERWLATRSNTRTVRRATWAFALVLAGVAVGWGVMTQVVEPAEEAREGKRAFAAFIRSQAPEPEPVLMFRAESHLLAFHLRRPIDTKVEWHDLAAWLREPGPRFVVMPPEYVYPAGEIVKVRRLVEVGRLEQFTGAKPPRPLVFLRTADE
ncbi:ArnT family glycosyltransferase [Urbifossiella limnaea]|uniref:ArnT family glycosyltransferase n=1 Tax=Urbifossiella limnaea TaxID=2528023 RepID=UPI00119E8C68|nr:phospholipid carrier-dependent glycosyltransferase [Urbifossiella limnaea]